jgi:hypothetical protein
MIGIVLALIMRAIFIVVGAAAINEFSWVFYLFGAFLLWTRSSWPRRAPTTTDDEEYEENRLVSSPRTTCPRRRSGTARSCSTKENGKRLITPMFLVVLTLGTTDLLFALDSIPAIYGLTQDPYLVFTANVFALMGLRQLYFLIGGLPAEAHLPLLRPGDPARLHRREAGAARHARERGAVHQRRRARRAGRRDPDLALAGDHRRHAGGHRRDQPRVLAMTRRRSSETISWASRRRLTCAECGARNGLSRVSSPTSLSVLDLVPVRSDQSTGDALRATLALAATADELGLTSVLGRRAPQHAGVAATNPRS